MRELTEELGHTENRIAFARQAFNDAVLDYNNAAQQAPANLVAGAVRLQAGGDARGDDATRPSERSAREAVTLAKLTMRFRQPPARPPSNATLRHAARLFALALVGCWSSPSTLVLALIYWRHAARSRAATRRCSSRPTPRSCCCSCSAAAGSRSMRLREGGAHVARLAGGAPGADLAAAARTAALERRLVNMVQEMAHRQRAAHRRPRPGCCRATDAINAFAAGWTRRRRGGRRHAAARSNA